MFAEEGDVILAALVGRLTDHRRIGGLYDCHKKLRIDLSRTEIGVPVGTGALGVTGIVAVHEVDAPGDAFDALNGVDQLLTGRPGVAGVETEPDAGVGDALPE